MTKIGYAGLTRELADNETADEAMLLLVAEAHGIFHYSVEYIASKHDTQTTRKGITYLNAGDLYRSYHWYDHKTGRYGFKRNDSVGDLIEMYPERFN